MIKVEYFGHCDVQRISVQIIFYNFESFYRISQLTEFNGYYSILYIGNIRIGDTLMSLFMMTPHEIALHIAKQAQAKRLALNFSQQTLSKQSGVSYGVLKKFERTGKISLKSLLNFALALYAESAIWSNEKRFMKQSKVKVFSTADVKSLLGLS